MTGNSSSSSSSSGPDRAETRDVSSPSRKYTARYWTLIDTRTRIILHEELISARRERERRARCFHFTEKGNSVARATVSNDETQGGPLHPWVKLTRGVDLSRRRVEADVTRPSCDPCRPVRPSVRPVSSHSFLPTAHRPPPPPPVHMPPRRPTAASPALLLLLLKGGRWAGEGEGRGGGVGCRRSARRGTMTERKAASAGDR